MRRRRPPNDRNPRTCKSGKHGYTSEGQAIRAANAAFQKYQVQSRTYRCPDCGKFHLTTIKAKGKKGKNMEHKAPGIRKLAESLVGETKPGCCPTCKKEVGPFRDQLSKVEFGISGMCQACQDSVFAEPEEDEQ